MQDKERLRLSSSNLGETGLDSIRVNGQRVEEMPVGTNNEAKRGLEFAREKQRLQDIATINAKYPSHRVDYLVSRINEAEENKNRMKKLRGDMLSSISEYRELVLNCKTRDRLLGELDFESHDYESDRKYIMAQWGPWDIEALKKQIAQFELDIGKVEAVLDQEDATIKQFSETVALCRKRDEELAALGAKAEGS